MSDTEKCSGCGFVNKTGVNDTRRIIVRVGADLYCSKCMTKDINEHLITAYQQQEQQSIDEEYRLKMEECAREYHDGTHYLLDRIARIIEEGTGHDPRKD